MAAALTYFRDYVLTTGVFIEQSILAMSQPDNQVVISSNTLSAHHSGHPAVTFQGHVTRPDSVRAMTSELLA